MQNQLDTFICIEWLQILGVVSQTKISAKCICPRVASTCTSWNSISHHLFLMLYGWWTSPVHQPKYNILVLSSFFYLRYHKVYMIVYHSNMYERNETMPFPQWQGCEGRCDQCRMHRTYQRLLPETPQHEESRYPPMLANDDAYGSRGKGSWNQSSSA